MISLQFFFRECFFVIFLKKTEQKNEEKNEKSKKEQKWRIVKYSRYRNPIDGFGYKNTIVK
tara:strand:+ start:215 stop:397 length:183 start_codon:yes stop_codon:yes gene_type:complete